MSTSAADLTRLALIVVAAAAGGAVNSVAGGGTLLTFPALIGLGVPALTANATSTVALWPGAVGSMLGYLGELRGARAWAVRFAIPSLAGGLAGALLLLVTPADRFDALVPWLVLGATGLFLIQRPAMRWLRAHAPSAHHGGSEPPDPALVPPPPAALAYQFLVGVYGGYFGAGIGILMLAALGFMGFTNIHRMNGLKNWGGLCANFMAAATFAFSGLVDWPVALAMALGAAVGGYGGSRLAQRVAQERVRQLIIAIGFASAIWLFVNRLS
ncbi:MAG: sulfite exporter TauE/SafE family protein [Gemmatimonadetes bacterium]|nr:sulfite exporter TauE/SafE family protein [Gemmatimonadota bacterium]MBK8646369.1 sulfite exporter TauE/SafE family protein [Gemmatimonadota bacterium]MBP9107398.1 sulfite exporter TauE/SafE family protein [Gemmatimonadaceae bacterium]